MLQKWLACFEGTVLCYLSWFVSCWSFNDRSDVTLAINFQHNLSYGSTQAHFAIASIHIALVASSKHTRMLVCILASSVFWRHQNHFAIERLQKSRHAPQTEEPVSQAPSTGCIAGGSRCVRLRVLEQLAVNTGIFANGLLRPEISWVDVPSAPFGNS